MQATASGQHTPVNRTKLAFFAAALLAGTIAGAAIMRTSDSADTTASHAVAPVIAQMPAWRFQEINVLPAESARESQGAATWRFREINELPATSTGAGFSFKHQHFLDINQLPGDDAPLVTPEMMRGSRS